MQKKTCRRGFGLLPIILVNSLLVSLSAPVSPIPEKIPCAIADRQSFTQPDCAHLAGWIGTRFEANKTGWLVKMDPERLLEGFRRRPGRQSYDGDHIGKWLDAATLVWANTGDPALRKKLDYTVAELMKCQLEDGYLGTYLDKDRWTDWDVWPHQMNLMGLIRYMRTTGNMAPLSTCQRMGDLLCKTFGDEPGKRDIIKAGHHVGMAPTTVVEPMVLLYRLTGEPRYLEFCKYILRAWEQPNGPKIISTLLNAKRVDKVANGKAYEMLSCLNGALEYYRTTGDRRMLEASLNAWQDIVDHRLYITGAASSYELFHGDFDLPNSANVGETCVTVTWLQFNAQLLRLTGEARFAEQLEHVIFNQLFGAQQCDGSGWGYYVQMEGRKPYSSILDANCCLSSGPRGIALIPTFAVTTDAEGVVVNLYDAGNARLNLSDGSAVTLKTDTLYPSNDRVRIKVDPSAEKAFSIKLRMPAWSPTNMLFVNGEKLDVKTETGGYAVIMRKWRPGDEVELRVKLEPRVVVGDHLNGGKIALFYGPLVLAADEALLWGEGKTIDMARMFGHLQDAGWAFSRGEDRTVNMVSMPGPDLEKIGLIPEPATAQVKTWPGARVFRVNAVARRGTNTLKVGDAMPIELIPFADAGATGSRYKVWLPLYDSAATANLLLDGTESRSRQGNATGSITDGSEDSFVVTRDGKLVTDDWFSVTLAEPARISRVVFVQGKISHDGGWFDASAGKPQVQVQTARDGAWKTAGEFAEYPGTTATYPAGLTGSEHFTCNLKTPVRVFGVRVAGKPASGDNPLQAFASCAELQAFESRQRGSP